MRIFDFRISEYCVYIINFEPFPLYNLPMYCTCCLYMHLNFKNVKKWFSDVSLLCLPFYGVCAHEKYFNFYIRHVTLSQKWKEYISPANISDFRLSYWYDESMQGPAVYSGNWTKMKLFNSALYCLSLFQNPCALTKPILPL